MFYDSTPGEFFIGTSLTSASVIRHVIKNALQIVATKVATVASTWQAPQSHHGLILDFRKFPTIVYGTIKLFIRCSMENWQHLVPVT